VLRVITVKEETKILRLNARGFLYDVRQNARAAGV
jgi:hypothetical protein